jgi:agmatinase
MNFFKIEELFQEFDEEDIENIISPDSKAVILPILYDATTSYKTGAREGAQAIIEACKNLELWDEYTLKDLEEKNIIFCPPILPDARGPKYMIEKITKKVTPLFQQGKFIVTLGGEHTVTLGIIKAILKTKDKKNLSVLHFDAHLDFRFKYQHTKYSHACVARRIYEQGVKIVPTGIRSFSQEEYLFVKKNKIKFFSAKEMIKDPKKEWIKEVLDQLTQEVYITFDLDVLDPGMMPSVGTPEPGGLGWYDILDLFSELSKERQIIGADITELTPIPHIHAPDFLTARLMLKMIEYLMK